MRKASGHFANNPHHLLPGIPHVFGLHVVLTYYIGTLYIWISDVLHLEKFGAGPQGQAMVDA